MTPTPGSRPLRFHERRAVALDLLLAGGVCAFPFLARPALMLEPVVLACRVCAYVLRIDHYASLGGALRLVGPLHEHWAVAALIGDLACAVDLVMIAPATVFAMLAPGVAAPAALVVRTQTHARKSTGRQPFSRLPIPQEPRRR